MSNNPTLLEQVVNDTYARVCKDVDALLVKHKEDPTYNWFTATHQLLSSTSYRLHGSIREAVKLKVMRPYRTGW